MIWSLIGILTLLLLADGAFVTAGIYSSLTTARKQLLQATAAIRSGEIHGADDLIESAQASAAKASSLTSHPAFTVAGILPGIGTEARIVDGVTRAVRLSTDAAGQAMGAMSALGMNQGEIAESLYANGRVRLGAIERAQPRLQGIAELLDRAQRTMDELATSRLPAINAIVNQSRVELASLSKSADSANALFAILPDLLGKHEVRRYLLVFQALGEARGTGGVVGIYGELQAEDGQLVLTRIGPFTDAVPGTLDQPVTAPRWFVESYGPQSALLQWLQANVSPNFPVVAEIFREMYAHGTGRSVDGVLALDPVALESYLQATGPVFDPVTDVRLASGNAGKVLMRDSYLRFRDRAAQDRFLARIVDGFWEKIRDGEFRPSDLARGVAESARTQHLKAYSVRDDEQRAFGELEVDGWPHHHNGNIQFVFHNNYGINKIDYFLQREIHTQVRVMENGEARINTRVRMRNTAPTGPASLLLGRSNRDNPPGHNRMLFNVLLPEEAQIRKFAINDDQALPPFSYEDEGHPVIWDLIEIPPGEEVTVRFSYVIPQAVQFSESLGEHFTLVLYPQTSAHPDDYVVRIEPPERYEMNLVKGSSRPLRVVQLRGQLAEPAEITVRLFPAGAGT